MVTCPDLKIEYLLSLGFKIIVIVKTLGDTSHSFKGVAQFGQNIHQLIKGKLTNGKRIKRLIS